METTQEAGKERMEGGILKVVGSGRNRENITQRCVIFCSHKRQRGGSQLKWGSNWD